MNAWLLDVARHAKLPRAEHLAAPLPDSPDEAWLTVCRACGIDNWALAKVVAGHYGLEVVPAVEKPDFAAAQLLPEAFARRYGLLAVKRSDGEMLVAIGYPPDKALAERLHFATELTPRFAIAPPGVIAMSSMAAYESAHRSPEGLAVDADPDLYAGGLANEIALDRAEDPNSAPVVRLANLILAEAIRLNATDVHLQPMFGGGHLRFRIDGALRRKAFVPGSVARRLIGRVKAVSGMDPTDRMHPQDGRLRVTSTAGTYDLRISTLPVHDGEKLVLRFLPQKGVQGLDRLGLAPRELAQIETLLDRGAGLVLVTGPTGSGKTTTLHAALAERNTTDVSIVTVEDPIEYRVPRLAQVQVNPESGLSFANALRSMLRQDPDIVLVGEMRDAETAHLAVQAALTGHLVLSTLHTLDAVSAIPRLLDLGVLRTFLGEALAGVVAQRLLRKLCDKCCVPASAPFTDDEARVMQAGVERPMRAAGCPACGFTGFRGRIVAAQVLDVTSAVRQMIIENAKLDALRATAHDAGMRTLAASALERVRAGETTAAEAVAELGNDFWRGLGIEPPLRSRRERRDEAPKVLLVERDAGARTALRAELERAGYVVEEAQHAGTARDQIELAGDFSAIVLDLDGLLTERVQRLLSLRDSLAGAAIPVVALSDQSAPALEDAVRAHGSTTLLSKPVDAARVVQTLRTWLK